MATHRVSILNGSVKPDSSGNVYFEPAAVNFGSNDLFDQMVVAILDSANREGLGGQFVVPKDYVGSPSIYVYWATTDTNGNDAEWDFDYVSAAATETADPSAATQSLNVAGTDSSTARALNVTEITGMTAGNLAVDDLLMWQLFRDGSDAGHTLTVTIYVFDVLFEYDDA